MNKFRVKRIPLIMVPKILINKSDITIAFNLLEYIYNRKYIQKF